MAHEFLSETHKKLVTKSELAALAVRQIMSNANVRGHEAHTMAHFVAFTTGGDLQELEEASHPFEQQMHDIWVEGNVALDELNYAIKAGGGQKVEHPNRPLTPRTTS